MNFLEKNPLQRLLRRWNFSTPLRGQIENYQAEFGETAIAFRRFLERGLLPPNTSNRAPIGVVVMPWVGTPVPWYSIALAIGLARRDQPIVLIWDDTPFPTRSEYLDAQNQAIEKMLARLGNAWQTIRLSALNVIEPSQDDDAALDQLTNLNLQWALRGASPTADDQLLADAMRANLRYTLSLIRALFQIHRFQYVIAPGGIYGSSSLFRWVGQERQVRVGTYDSGLGWMTVCPDGIAAQHFDLPRAFENLLRAEESTKRWACLQAEAELERRRAGRDRAQYQPIASAAAPRQTSDVLIALNVDWDASALGRHTIFADRMDWLYATIAFLLEQSEQAITVREHPAERRQRAPSQTSLGALLRERFGDTTRLRFVGADAAVNTYDLLDDAALVLPFVSTVGIEAAAMQKRVILAGAPYYADLGFAYAPATRSEYFDLLARGLAGKLELLPQQRERALLCYHLSTSGNVVWTNFTPQPSDFWKWCRAQPTHLWSDAAVQDLLVSLDENEPIAWLRHRRLRRMNEL